MLWTLLSKTYFFEVHDYFCLWHDYLVWMTVSKKNDIKEKNADRLIIGISSGDANINNNSKDLYPEI